MPFRLKPLVNATLLALLATGIAMSIFVLGLGIVEVLQQ